MTSIVIAFVALVGGSIGSFLGVVSARGWRRSLGGRSHCDDCGRTLAWFDTLPLVSFIALRGRCRVCGARFGVAPLLWEIGGAAVGVALVLPLAFALSW